MRIRFCRNPEEAGDRRIVVLEDDFQFDIGGTSVVLLPDVGPVITFKIIILPAVHHGPFKEADVIEKDDRSNGVDPPLGRPLVAVENGFVVILQNDVDPVGNGGHGDETSGFR